MMQKSLHGMRKVLTINNPTIKQLLDEIEKYHLYDDGYWVGVYMNLKTWQELRRKYGI